MFIIIHPERQCDDETTTCINFSKEDHFLNVLFFWFNPIAIFLCAIFGSTQLQFLCVLFLGQPNGILRLFFVCYFLGQPNGTLVPYFWSARTWKSPTNKDNGGQGGRDVHPGASSDVGG